MITSCKDNVIMGKNLIFVKIKIDRNEEDKSTYFTVELDVCKF